MVQASLRKISLTAYAVSAVLTAEPTLFLFVTLPSLSLNRRLSRGGPIPVLVRPVPVFPAKRNVSPLAFGGPTRFVRLATHESSLHDTEPSGSRKRRGYHGEPVRSDQPFNVYGLIARYGPSIQV